MFKFPISSERRTNRSQPDKSKEVNNPKLPKLSGNSCNTLQPDNVRLVKFVNCPSPLPKEDNA